ncbi:hypothetical protein CCR95_11075 [Thiocystis minor]|jgi:hypothetical protein|uniref:hypothetical protein n=1 Tax=Thiocystis minor TaxID=61597 RepID=UPI0019133BBC|nr:hypothetical protein [Thiocystis minor]MBK5964607.1 hypothetical protein [Thiocystis minor]
MTVPKITTVTFRIKPGIKDALRQAAEQEHRSLANMLEVMIRDWCGREKIAVSQPASVERRT